MAVAELAVLTTLIGALAPLVQKFLESRRELKIIDEQVKLVLEQTSASKDAAVHVALSEQLAAALAERQATLGDPAVQGSAAVQGAAHTLSQAIARLNEGGIAVRIHSGFPTNAAGPIASREATE